MAAIKMAMPPRFLELQKKMNSEGLNPLEITEFARLMEQVRVDAGAASAKVIGEISDSILNPAFKAIEDALNSADGDTLASLPGHMSIHVNRMKKPDGTFEFTVEKFTKRGSLTKDSVLSGKQKADKAEAKVVDEL